MLTSTCIVCDRKKLRLIKEQEAKSFLKTIGKNPIFGPYQYNY